MNSLALNTNSLYSMLSQYAASSMIGRLSSNAGIVNAASKTSGLTPGKIAAGASQSLLSSYQNQVKISEYGQLRSALSTLQSSAHALSQANKLVSFKTFSTNGAAIATANNSAAAGSYHIVVNQWAQFQTLQSSAYSSDTEPIGSGSASKLTITTGNAATKITIDNSNNSLKGIAQAINDAKSGVTASITNDASGYRLSLSADPMGPINSFSLSTSGDASLQERFSYAPGAAGGMTQTVAAQNASFTVNGAAFSKTSNLINDAIQGVTLDLGKISSANPNTVLTVSPDSTGIEKAAQDFANAYNSLLNTANSILKNDKTIADDPKIQLALSGTQSIINQYNSAGKSALTQIGITPQKDGSLLFNASTLKDAFNSNSNAIMQGLSSIGQMMENLIQNQINPLSYDPTAAYANNTKSLSPLESLQNSLKLYTQFTGYDFSSLTPDFTQIKTHDYSGGLSDGFNPTSTSNATPNTSSGSTASDPGSTPGSGGTQPPPTDDDHENQHHDSGWHRSENGAKHSNNYYDYSSSHESNSHAQMLARLRQLGHENVFAWGDR